MNKLVNADLEHIFSWLNANKISLNIKKLIRWSKQNKFEGDLKIGFYDKRLYPTEDAKYLGIKFDANLNWQCQVNRPSIEWSQCSPFQNNETR